MTDYKASKEAFVSGMTGSSVGHINLVSSAALASIALHSALRTRLSSSNPTSFAVEWLTLVAPLLLSVTLFADTPGVLIFSLLFPSGLLLLIPRRESGTPLPSPLDTSPKLEFPTASSTAPVIIGQLPAVSIYRSHMMLMTILSILAVDFPIFPRSLAKCETYGVSLMDLGVGSFVFAQGLVSAIPILKDPSYLSQPMLDKISGVVQKVWPILALGLIRVLLVKGTDYPEHVTEYGVHWNFFITLALLPIFQVLLHPLIAVMPISLLAVLYGLAHQLTLSWMGLQDWALFAPRTNVISANKEGIVSLFGYLAIHLLGLSAGTIILPPSPNYFRRQQQAQAKRKRKYSNAEAVQTGRTLRPIVHREDDRTATELISYAVVWWFLMFISTWANIGGGVSRRLVNLTYILWVAAYNTTFLLGYLLLELFFFPSPFSKSVYSPTSKLKVQADTVMANTQAQLVPRQGPALLEAINRNSLVLFLLASLANVLTGLINLTLPTMYTSDAVAMIILSAYALAISAVAWATRGRRIWRI
ncbi:GWT1-domain-containing protein [Heliocybe sulcata]|uniref:GPI-anchored wall transfer protein n=1 Tax=Heliocybe sulcata TaxID=5364 RepID=A0A5C3N6F1_9AGAM|nr:GWT1-domain-containing protein [Heliocybe sulcata]